MTTDEDREIKEIRRRIKENQTTMNTLHMKMKKALSEANEYDKQIGKMRAENVKLMKRLNDLGNRKLKDRMRVVFDGGRK